MCEKEDLSLKGSFFIIINVSNVQRNVSEKLLILAYYKHVTT